jgi:putative transposase
MTSYRRNYQSGGTYFFTVNLADRQQSLLTDNIGALRTAFSQTRAERGFTIDAMVVLPEHLHAIWTLPDNDSDFSTRWRLIKSRFSRAIGLHQPVS